MQWKTETLHMIVLSRSATNAQDSCNSMKLERYITPQMPTAMPTDWPGARSPRYIARIETSMPEVGQTGVPVGLFSCTRLHSQADRIRSELNKASGNIGTDTTTQRPQGRIRRRRMCAICLCSLWRRFTRSATTSERHYGRQLVACSQLGATVNQRCQSSSQ